MMLQRLRLPVLLLCVAVGLLVVAPVFLLLFDLSPAQNDRIAGVAAIYSAISTVLSAMALAGVAVSLVFQAQSNRTSAHVASRQSHMALLNMSMDDAELRACTGGTDPPDPGISSRQQAYTNMFFTLWEMQLDIGFLTPEYIARHVNSTFRSSPVARHYWQRARVARVQCGCNSRPFFAIADREYEVVSRELASNQD